MLTRPEGLTIKDGNECHYGANQEWYSQVWRQKAGCGPTTAAVQLCYLARTRPALAGLCPPEIMGRTDFVAYMDAVWEHVTPGPCGLNTVGKYTAGVERFAAARDIRVAPLELVVPKKVTARPSFYDCAAFIRASLERDCPVAFLNLHNGRVENLDAWHWVLITELRCDSDGAICAVADGGKRLEIDLRLWYDTTKDGGGFVAIPAEEKA